MRLRSRLLLGVVLVILATVGLCMLGVGFLVQRQNDQNGVEMVSLGKRLVLNRLNGLKLDTLEKVRRFVTLPENLVNLKYLEASGEQKPGNYMFALDSPKEELAERLKVLMEAGPFDAFRLFGARGELLASAEQEGEIFILAIASRDDSGASRLKYQRLAPGAEIEHAWDPGPPMTDRLHLVHQAAPERDFWFDRRQEGMALVGVVPVKRGIENSWGNESDILGLLEFRVPLGRGFAGNLTEEIGMRVDILPIDVPGASLDPEEVRIVYLETGPHYRVEIPLEGLGGVEGTLAVSLSRQDALKKTGENVALLVCLTLVCLAAAVPASFWVANRFCRRIELVVNAVGQISGGNLEVRVQGTGSDELGRLGDSVNAMAGELQVLLDRLRLSENKYRSIYEHATEGIFQSTTEGRLLNVSPALVRMLGFDSPQQMLTAVTGFTDPVMVHPQDVEGFDLLFATRGELGSFEARLRRRDGTPIWVMICARPIPADGGEASILQGFVVDISEIREAEAALRDKEALFRAILESTHEGVLVVDDKGAVSHYNRRFAEIWSLPESVLESREDNALLDFVLPQLKDPDEFLAGVKDIYSRNETTLCVLHFRDGRVIERFSSPVSSHGGSRGRVWFFRDITSQVESEAETLSVLQQAREARARVDAILHSVPHGLMVIDSDRFLVLLNRAAESLLGVRLEDVFHFPVFGVVKEDAFLRQVEASFEEQEQAGAVELDLYDHEKGEVRKIQASISLVRQEGEAVSGAVVVLLDVTRERELARMKSEFVSVAAHELNTPLTAVIGYAELLLDQDSMRGFSPEEQREFLELVYEKSQSLSRIVDELLFMSRMEAGRGMLLQVEPFEVQEVLRKTVELFSAGANSGRFALFLPSEPVELTADRGKFTQVLENLISNAIKYSSVGSPIRIYCRKEGELCRFEVEDEGRGMTPNQVERIFEKFYRADFSNTAIGGLGIGMSIVKSIIDVHGGDIRVESALGKGTRVIFSFPQIPFVESLPLTGVHS